MRFGFGASLICAVSLLTAACEKNELPASEPEPSAEAPKAEVEAPPAEPAAPTGEPASEKPGSEAKDLPVAAAPQPQPGELVVSNEPCQKDEDCVAASCCHASACVARANAPSCEGKMCTMNCQEGTMDCGGGCLCHEGFCAAQLAGPLTPEG